MQTRATVSEYWFQFSCTVYARPSFNTDFSSELKNCNFLPIAGKFIHFSFAFVCTMQCSAVRHSLCFLNRVLCSGAAAPGQLNALIRSRYFNDLMYTQCSTHYTRTGADWVVCVRCTSEPVIVFSTALCGTLVLTLHRDYYSINWFNLPKSIENRKEKSANSIMLFVQIWLCCFTMAITRPQMDTRIQTGPNWMWFP